MTGEPGCIVITGATSGIGEALALQYAAPGRVLGLTGRDAGRLAAVTAACTEKGAQVVCGQIDVTDAAAMADWLAALDAKHTIDLVIANAGFINVLDLDTPVEAQATVAQVMETNFLGIVNTVHPVVPLMKARGRGHIALMSSVSGVTPFPPAPAYTASKAAVRGYGDALRIRLRPHGIAVSVILPGFVKSRLDRSYRANKPLRLGAPKAARIIARGLGRRQARIGLPGPFYLSARLVAGLPAWLGDRLLRRMFGRADPG